MGRALVGRGVSVGGMEGGGSKWKKRGGRGIGRRDGGEEREVR